MAWVGYEPAGRRSGRSDTSSGRLYRSGGVGEEPLRPEVADLSRLARRLIRRTVEAARVDEAPTLRRLLAKHLGQEVSSLPVVGANWPAYDHVNVQVGLEHWLGEVGRSHVLVGITGFEHRRFTLADLAQPARDQFSPGIGSVSMVSLESGPDGATHPAVRCALYLVNEAEGQLALLVYQVQDHGPAGQPISVEITGPDPERSSAVLDELRQAALAHNVFRGQVVAFSSEIFGPAQAPIRFQHRPSLAREALVLPQGTLDMIERHVVGITNQREKLLAAGQHLKRGVLLHGPPGTGKTHTVRYLLGRLEGVTVVVLSGQALGAIGSACSIARTLQPSVVVVEDVDLIAEHRGMHPGQHPLLFGLLNEMDGLGEDVDVAFVLTTNRADLLEPALAARPGRVDQAVEIPPPDAAGRRRLIELYKGNMTLEVEDLSRVIERTDGVTASFLKELLRRAALLAADGTGNADGPAPMPSSLVVGDVELDAALNQLLDSRNRLTRALLGSADEAS